MAIGYAAATFALGAYNAYNTQKSLYKNANERDRAAKESLLTAKYNINQRKIESRQTQFQVLETGGRTVGEIAQAGLKAEGAAEVAGGSSGATIDSGSPRAALINIAREALTAQTNVVKDTRNRIKSIGRQTENINRSEWRNAKLNERQQQRISIQERESADIGFKTDLIKTGIKSYTAGATMSGTGDVSKWGAWGKKTNTVKELADQTQKTGAHVAQSSVKVRPKRGPAGAPPRPRKKVNWNIAHKSKYSYGSHKSNKVFYPKGKALQSGKIPGGGSYYKNRGLKSSPYNQTGYKPLWNEEGGWLSNLRNFFRGTGLYGTASSKRYK